jgi:serine O-acetyltransferase
MRLVREIVGDTVTIARAFTGGTLNVPEVLATMSHDGSQVLALSRLAEAARRHRVPFLGGVVRRVQTSLFGIEIGRDVQLGEGVVFVHTVGIVIGGDSRVGDRVFFLGGNTIGSVNTGGYPRIGNDVIIGAGARILGPITIGDGASIGANAVVLCDVPPGAVALGVPAVVRPRRAQPTAREPNGAS